MLISQQKSLFSPGFGLVGVVFTPGLAVVGLVEGPWGAGVVGPPGPPGPPSPPGPPNFRNNQDKKMMCRV